MRTKEKRTVLAAMCLLAACSSDSTDPFGPNSTGGAGTTTGSMVAATSTAGATTATVSTGAPTDTTGAPASTTVIPTDTTSTSTTTAGSTGSATTGSTDSSEPAKDAGLDAGSEGGTADGGGPPSGVPVPRIPEVSEACPAFESGTMKILGMRAAIEAGSPGPVKGALVFGFHGTGGIGAGNLPSSVVDEITSEGGLFIRPTYNTRDYPAETDIAVGTNTWYVSDMEWVDRVTACAVAEHNIDPNRIYATGCSAGGLMSGSLGLMRSEYIAAVAPNSGGINQPGSRELSSDRGPAAFLMHGGSGDNVIINFQQSSGWFEDVNKMAPSMPYMLDCNHGRGHCGAPAELFKMAWEFFKAHPYGVAESPWRASPPADLPDYCEEVM